MFEISINDKSYKVDTDSKDGLTGKINNSDYQMDLVKDDYGYHLLLDNKSYRLEAIEADYQTKEFTIKVNGNPYQLKAADKFDLLLKELGMEATANKAQNELKAPMPGLVLKLKVEVGQAIEAGDPLVVLEAMKMENILKAMASGTVKSITVKEGVAVEKNQILIEFETD